MSIVTLYNQSIPTRANPDSPSPTCLPPASRITRAHIMHRISRRNSPSHHRTLHDRCASKNTSTFKSSLPLPPKCQSLGIEFDATAHGAHTSNITTYSTLYTCACSAIFALHGAAPAARWAQHVRSSSSPTMEPSHMLRYIQRREARGSFRYVCNY